MKKNLLFLFNQFPGLGGVESVSNNIIGFLAPDYAIYTLTINAQAEVIAPEGILGMYQFESITDRTTCVELLNRIIEEKQIDYIINQGIYPDISDILFDSRRSGGVKVLSFLHGMPKYEEQFYWQIVAGDGRIQLFKKKLLSALGINKKHSRMVYRFADSYTKACQMGDKVILLCDEYIEPFLREYGLEAYRGKVLAINNLLSVDYSQQRSVDWGSKKNKVLYVGRLAVEKRVDIILDIWKKTQTQTGDWQLVIVGDGDARAKLESTVRKEKIERVVFVGQHSYLETYYKEAKIILLTSIIEGFTMCLLEAQRFGVVPLSFDICEGVRSVVAGGGGVLVPQDDRTAMAVRLKELIADDAELRRLSKEVEINSDRYTIDVIGKQWKKLLNEA